MTDCYVKRYGLSTCLFSTVLLPIETFVGYMMDSVLPSIHLAMVWCMYSVGLAYVHDCAVWLSSKTVYVLSDIG